MSKHLHEIRCPIHVFVRLDSDERAVLDSRPFQRLRHIHQLALTYLIYPTATHKRFEHSLGVMELAGRVFDRMTPPLRPEDVEKLAVGQKEAKDLSFSTWESILSEIIVGDAFGVVRMDYLLRDSYHSGVAYGRFDHFRLIDTLRVLPSGENDSDQPTLGVEEGGLHSAEALLLARYYMYSQVYFHPVRRIYDIHLKDFLAADLPVGKFPTDLESHLQNTDNEVNERILSASRDSALPGHDAARRIVGHQHYKTLYQRHPEDVRVNPNAGKAVFDAAVAKFGAENVRHDSYTQRRDPVLFPVLCKDGRVVTANQLSEALQHLPVVAVDFVFIKPELLREATTWLQASREQIIQPPKEQ